MSPSIVSNKADYDTMPPRRGTPWVSHSSLLSDRIRPSSGSPQPKISEKGKGKAKAVTPEPPPRSDAVRKLDELLDGLRSSPTSNQPRKAEAGRVTGASADREGCFCQGTSACLSCLVQIECASLFRFPIQSVISFLNLNL